MPLTDYKKSLTLYSISIFLLISCSMFSQVTITMDDLVYDLLGEPYNQQLGKPWGEHEGFLHGVPSGWDWYWGARPGAWMNSGDNKAINLWAQAYEWKEESPVTNIRIQVRNMKLYALVNGQWQVLAEGNTFDQMEGSNWSENFQGSSDLSDVRSEKNNGGGMSFKMLAGYNYHWWVKQWPRATIPDGVQAFYSVAEMRLIPDTDPDVDLNQAKYLASIGNDYYTTTTSAGPGPWPSLAIARHKFITPEWQAFTAYISGDAPTDENEYYDLILSQPLPPGVTSTSVGKTESNMPITPEIYQNIPNPFNGVTRIPFYLHCEGHVILKIYNTTGREVNVLIDQKMQPGSHQVLWKPQQHSSGQYFVCFTIDGRSVTQPLMYIK